MVKQFESHGYLVNTGVTAAPGGTASVKDGMFRVALSGLKGDPRALLTALASNNKIRILSNPSVMARNGEQATIQVGQEVPILTSQISNANTGTPTGGTGTLQTIQYRSTGVILKVKPVIHAGGRIEIEISQEVSAAQLNETGVNSSPVILTRKLDTKLSVSDGNTVLLGGLISEQSTKGHAGIPFLKDIPYIGAAFRTSMSESRERTELVILLTPYVVEDDFDARSITEAFRNQFSWAQPMPTALKATEEKATTDGRTAIELPNNQDGTSASPQVPPSQFAPQAPVANTPPQKSRPYRREEEEQRQKPQRRSAVNNDVGLAQEATVAPLQQNPAGKSANADAQKNPAAAVIDLRHGDPVPQQEAVSSRRPVTDQALLKELMQAVQKDAVGK